METEEGLYSEPDVFVNLRRKMITRNYFHTLEEWIPLLKTIKCKKYRINTYGNYWNDGSFKRFIETFDEEDEKLKKSNVCNIEVHSFIDTVVIDVDYIRFYKDSKDDIIADLWEKLYWNNTNADRMEELFKRCQAGLASKSDFEWKDGFRYHC